MRLTPLAALPLAMWAVLFASSTLSFGDTTLTMESGSGFPGDEVVVTITLDTDETLNGFAAGIAHDGAILTLESITEGADVDSVNSGGGPDYFQVNTDPLNGPGGFFACVVDFELSGTLPALDAQEVAVFTYTIDAAATPGASSALTFTDTLGDPPVETVVVPEVAPVVPALNDGAIDVTVPPVEALVCTLTDPCLCLAELTWTNGATYDAINIFDGVILIAELAGDATSYIADLDNGVSMLSVFGVSLGTSSAAATCEVDCPVIPVPTPPSDLTCAPDGISPCTVNVTWTNTSTYDSIDVLLDGIVIETLAGTVESTTVDLDDDEMHTIALIGNDICDQLFSQVSCDTMCPPDDAPLFLRGDCDGNGTVFPIIDALYLLEFGFTAGPAPPCSSAADADDNGSVFAIIDALFILEFGFNNGPAPPAPGPDLCGPDPTVDTLTCDTPPDPCP